MNYFKIFTLIWTIGFSGLIYSNSLEEGMSHFVLVNLISKVNKEDELKKKMLDLKQNLPLVNGCLSVKVFQSSTDLKKFTIVEEWDSEKNHQNHITNISKDDGLKEILDLLEKPLDGKSYKQL